VPGWPIRKTKRPAASTTINHKERPPTPTADSAQVLAAAVALATLTSVAPAAAQQASAADIAQMMAVIEAQQAQIDDGMRADAMRAERPPAAAPSAPVAVTATRPPPPRPAGLDDRTEAQIVTEGFTWHDQSGRSLTFSGQVNPAFNIVDDGLTSRSAPSAPNSPFDDGVSAAPAEARRAARATTDHAS
jgi:hypothetical protein